MNPIAYALKFMKTVGADNRKCRLTYWLNRRLYSALKLSFRTNLPASRHQIMVTVNEMDRMDCLYRRNPLGQIYKSTPTVHGILFQQPEQSTQCLNY